MNIEDLRERMGADASTTEAERMAELLQDRFQITETYQISEQMTDTAFFKLIPECFDEPEREPFRVNIRRYETDKISEPYLWYDTLTEDPGWILRYSLKDQPHLDERLEILLEQDAIDDDLFAAVRDYLSEYAPSLIALIELQGDRQ